MAQKQQAKPQNKQKNTTKTKSSYSAVLERMNNLMSAYSNLPMNSIYNAFGRSMGYWANQPSVQNARVKAISPLPCDYTKEELGEFLRTPQNSELQLQQVSEGLKWTSYPFFKVGKSYSDMSTYRNYVIPQYIDKETIKTENFMREFRLVDKIRKACNIPKIGHKVTGQAMAQGKVFYVMRYNVDKSHNKVNHIFYQELPKSWSTIIGLNNISDYTVSFNLMYFMQPGTDYRQFGDLFEPYMADFNDWVTADNRKAFKSKYVYASRNNAIDSFEYEAKAWQQNGQWMYFVSLPIDRVWTFEIDDTTPIVASPLSGLMQTFAQQADYEAAQLSLVLNPLIKILTGEIPYYQSNQSKEDNGFRLTYEARTLFEAYFNALMAQTNTAGVGFYTAPVENIKSHDFSESANANDVSNSFLTYGANKTGLNALIPITDRPTEEAVKASELLEPRYTQCIYRTLERMINYLLGELSLNYDWQVHIFGDVYSDEQTRADCLKLIDKGSTYAYFKLCALDDISILDAISMMDTIKNIGLLDKLSIPPTAYTQTTKSQPKSDTNGAPTKTEQEKQEDSTIDSGVDE